MFYDVCMKNIIIVAGINCFHSTVFTETVPGNQECEAQHMAGHWYEAPPGPGHIPDNSGSSDINNILNTGLNKHVPHSGGFYVFTYNNKKTETPLKSINFK